MTTRAFQKIYTKIDNITKATVTLRALGVGNDELATVGGKLAQVVKIMGENVTLQVFSGTEGIATDSEVVFPRRTPETARVGQPRGPFLQRLRRAARRR